MHMSTLSILHRDIKLTNIFIGAVLPRKHWYAMSLTTIFAKMPRAIAKVIEL